MTLPFSASASIRARISDDLDHRHRYGEHQRPERFTDAVRDHFGVMDRGEDGASQRERA